MRADWTPTRGSNRPGTPRAAKKGPRPGGQTGAAAGRKRRSGSTPPKLGFEPGPRRAAQCARMGPHVGVEPAGVTAGRKMGRGFDPNLGVETGPRRAANKRADWTPMWGSNRPEQRRAAKGARIRPQPGGQTKAAAGRATHTQIHQMRIRAQPGLNRGNSGPQQTCRLDPDFFFGGGRAGAAEGCKTKNGARARPQFGGRTGPRRAADGARNGSQSGGRTGAAAARLKGAWIRPQPGVEPGPSRATRKQHKASTPNVMVEPEPRRAAHTQKSVRLRPQTQGSSRGRGGPQKQNKTKQRGFDPNLGSHRAAAGRKTGARIRCQPGRRTGAVAGSQMRADSTPIFGSNRSRGGPENKNKRFNDNFGVEPGPQWAAKSARIRPRPGGRKGAVAGRAQ